MVTKSNKGSATVKTITRMMYMSSTHHSILYNTIHIAMEEADQCAWKDIPLKPHNLCCNGRSRLMWLKEHTTLGSQLGRYQKGTDQCAWKETLLFDLNLKSQCRSRAMCLKGHTTIGSLPEVLSPKQPAGWQEQTNVPGRTHHSWLPVICSMELENTIKYWKE